MRKAAVCLLCGALASLALSAPSTASSSAQTVVLSTIIAAPSVVGTMDARFNTWYESEPGTLDGLARGAIIILR